MEIRDGVEAIARVYGIVPTPGQAVSGLAESTGPFMRLTLVYSPELARKGIRHGLSKLKAGAVAAEVNDPAHKAFGRPMEQTQTSRATWALGFELHSFVS